MARPVPGSGSSGGAARLGVGALLAAGIVAAVGLGFAVGQGAGPLVLGAIIAPLAMAVILVRPAAALVVWLIAIPFVFGEPTTLNLAVIWVLHRLLIPFCLVVLLQKHVSGVRRSPFRLHTYDLGLIAFMGLGVANILLLASNPQRTLVQFHDFLIVPMLLFWLIRALGPEVLRSRALVWIAAAIVVFQGIVGILSWVAPGVLPNDWLGREGERTTGTMGGPGPFTVTLVAGVLLLICLLARDGRGRRLLILLPCLTLAATGVLVSLSRGSWLGAGAALLVIALLVPGAMRVVVPVAVVAVLLVTVGPWASDLAVAEQRIDTARTVDERLATNDAAGQMIAQRPLLGFGYGNFELFDEGFKSTVAGIALRKQVSVHHSYLALAAENGLTALALYLAPAVAVLAASVRRWRALPSGHLDRLWLALLWACLLDQAVVSSFMDMLHSSAWGTSLWWLTLGMIVLVLERPQPAGLRPAGAALPPGVRVAWHAGR